MQVLVKRAAAVLAVLCLLVLMPTGTKAGAQWVTSDYIEGRLISTSDAAGSSQDQLIAIELKLKPGWKTYWRTPGDAGLPPETDWSGSANLKKATLLYPKPERFELFGLQTFGYDKRVVFPVMVQVASPGAALDLRLNLSVLVCSDVCVPQALTLALHLDEGPASPGDEAHTIQRALADVPVDDKSVGVSLTEARAINFKSGEALEVSFASHQPLHLIDIIPDIEPFAAFKAPVITSTPDQKSITAIFALSQPLPPGESLAGRTAKFVLTRADGASESQAQIVDGGAQAGSSSGMFAVMIGLAVLGGLILNLMPCVLPVLSVKVLSLLESRDLKASQVRAKFLATAAGIITALLALAALLIAIQLAGHSVGWGIQFQQPLFIVTLVVIVTLFACNLWGLFEISLPSWLVRSVGNHAYDETSYAGHFLTGVFVTILATPCSAPFVGTAVGFALASGTVMTLAIFLALGVGLALPYIAVAVRPSLVRLLPKPGPWIIKLKLILGFALLATAVWLLSILDSQSGSFVSGVVSGAVLALIASLLWRARTGHARTRSTAAMIAVLCAGIALLMPAISAEYRSGSTAYGDGPIAWQPFDDTAIRSLIAQGKTVFVDVTADWCITCKANKQLVLNQDDLATLLNSEAITMQADWTKPDEKISAFLARFGRYGIPMNVVFGPGSPQGIVLPEILTKDSVKDALSRASRKQQALSE